MARPAFKPTEEQRKLVEQLAAFGVPVGSMCVMVVDARGGETEMGWRVQTLRRTRNGGFGGSGAGAGETHQPSGLSERCRSTLCCRVRYCGLSGLAEI